MAALRSSIALKIFGVAVGLLVLMAIVALLNLRMTRDVDGQLVVIDKKYVPAVNALAQAHIEKLDQSSTSRRLVAAFFDEQKQDPKYIEDLRNRITAAGTESAE